MAKRQATGTDLYVNGFHRNATAYPYSAGFGVLNAHGTTEGRSRRLSQGVRLLLPHRTFECYAWNSDSHPYECLDLLNGE